MTIETEKEIGSDTKVNGYVANGLPVPYHEEYGQIIDLGLAANPCGAAIKASDLHALVTTKNLSEYDEDVHHKDIKKLLIEGIGLQNITYESVIFHPNGSYGAGDEVVRELSHYLSENGRRVIVYAPTYSFPNVAQYTVRHNADYKPLPCGDTLFQEGSLMRVLQMNSDLRDNIVYIDYPNNPSGVANGELLRDVISHVHDHKGIPFVDLAFGEVLGDEFRDAMQFTIDRGGICVGSLTKTQGLPALRAGYIIASPEFSKTLFIEDYTQLVFGLSVQAKRAFEILFAKQENEETEAQIYAKKAAGYNICTNGVLYEALHRVGLRVAPTTKETPIQVVQGEGDIYRRLATVGIKTESLKDYSCTLPEGADGYGDSAVRILTPRIGMLDETLERIDLAMSLSG